MVFTPANHYVISGLGIDGVVDTAGISGSPVVSLSVDDHLVRDASLATTQQEGIVVEGTVEEVPDRHTLGIRLTVPQVNLSDGPVTVSGFAALTRALTSVGGPGLVAGALHLYELRPVAGTASATVT